MKDRRRRVRSGTDVRQMETRQVEKMVVSDFATRQMEKMGHKMGEGLGKAAQGQYSTKTPKLAVFGYTCKYTNTNWFILV